jgi:hypothetical protein
MERLRRRGNKVMSANRASRANTTALIASWSMAGAPDLDGRFASVVDIEAFVAERDRESHEHAPRRIEAPLLLKPAGEDEWHTLARVAESA